MKIYKDSKELPFLIYKKIMQTGDFLYMIKGYENGDEVEADPEKLSVLKTQLEDKFNDLITDFVISINAVNEDLQNQSNYFVATLEFNKLSVAINLIEDIQKRIALAGDVTLPEDLQKEISDIISEILEGIKVQRDLNLEKQKEKLIEKMSVHESNILKYDEIINKEKDSETDNDLDKQFINVCLGLEIPFPDENKISLYQFSIMIDKAVEKAKALEKINSK